MFGDPQITISGNICADPVIRFTTSGIAVAQVTIAHTPRRKDAAGQWQDGTPTFLRAEAWRYLAEHIGESLRKGDRVIATGALRTDKWQDKESGEERTAPKLVIEDLGGSLMYANIKISKAQRDNGPAPTDPWSGETATQSQPPTNGTAHPDGSFSDEPPF